MEKRGQATVFIIIAIVIVALVVGAYFLFQGDTESKIKKELDKLGISVSADVVTGSIEDCIKSTGEDALVVVGIQGGYYDAPSGSFDLGWAAIPYYYDVGSISNPSKEIIEGEVSRYVDENIDLCLNGSDFEGFVVRVGESKTSAEISNRRVDFNTDFNVNIIKSGQTADIDFGKYPYSVDSKLYEILEISDYITESHNEDPDMICINCVADMAEERDLYVDFLEFGDDTTLTVISDNSTAEDYIFQFLNRYPE